MPLLHSPALSLSDDDLDTLLEAQGALSHWPTPPLMNNKVPSAATAETEAEDEAQLSADTAEVADLAVDDFVKQGLDCNYLAHLFTVEASIDVSSTPSEVDDIRFAIASTALPPEVLALTFNVLQALHARYASQGYFSAAPSCLLVIAAMTLANTCFDDFVPTFSYWSLVGRGLYSGMRIDKTALQIFFALDWTLHDLYRPEQIRATLDIFTLPRAAYRRQSVVDLRHRKLLANRRLPPPLKLVNEDASSCWKHGQITPAVTPPCAAAETKPSCYLPLL